MRLPRLEHPIVLVHGLFGFDKIQVGTYTLANYFPGIAEALQEAGNRVFAPSLSPTCGIEERARQLKTFLYRACPYDKVHLIAHSLGGLDSRCLISRLGMASHVATLTTLGTPHRGSPFADWGVSKVEWIARPTLNLLDMPYQAFYDLTSARCREFNEQTPDDPGVRYFSVAAEHDGSRPEWLLPYTIVKSAEGANDGVVSLQSAKYGESFDIWPGDHFTLVNWHAPKPDCEDMRTRWKRILDRLETPRIANES